MNVDSWRPVVSINGTLKLSDSSARVDLLVPILGLEGDLEELVLDMHYSIIRPRVWSNPKCANVANEIIGILHHNRAIALKELTERKIVWDPEQVVRDWSGDLQTIVRTAAHEEVLIFERSS